MLPPHLAFSAEVQTINWGRTTTRLVLANFGNEGKYLNSAKAGVFAGFETFRGLYQRPVNQRRKRIMYPNGDMTFTGWCLFMSCLEERSSWFPGKVIDLSTSNEYVVFEIPHPAWKPISAAFNRAKKDFGWREIVLTPPGQRLLRKFIELRRKMRDGYEVAGVSG